MNLSSSGSSSARLVARLVLSSGRHLQLRHQVYHGVGSHRDGVVRAPIRRRCVLRNQLCSCGLFGPERLVEAVAKQDDADELWGGGEALRGGGEAVRVLARYAFTDNAHKQGRGQNGTGASDSSSYPLKLVED